MFLLSAAKNVTFRRLIQPYRLFFGRFRSQAASASLTDHVPADALERYLAELSGVLLGMLLAMDLHLLPPSAVLVA